ncbi:MAG: SDR family NAD(P)-dependent oxidoreductase, partial [Pseudomonadota bacterium]
MQLANVRAVVTGGASGLGEATVREIAGAGGHVAILDRDTERGTAVATELGAK